MTTEDLLYEIYEFGLLDEVFEESKKLKEISKFQHAEYKDVLLKAYDNVKRLKK